MLDPKAGGARNWHTKAAAGIARLSLRAILVIAWSVVEAGETAWANERRMYSGN
jgi:hypothetical protein